MVLDTDRFDRTVICCIAPWGCTLSKMGGMLIVVLGLPEIGFQRSLQQLFAIDDP